MCFIIVVVITIIKRKNEGNKKDMWPCFLELTHQCLVQRQRPQFAVSSRGVHQRFLMVFCSSYTSSLKSCSQMFIVPKGSDMNKVWLWSMGCFFLVRDTSQKSDRETWSRFSLNSVSDFNSAHCIWKYAGNVFTSNENGIENIQKKKKIFLATLKLVLKFLYHNEKHGNMFFTVCQTVFIQYFRIVITWACRNLSFILNVVMVWNTLQISRFSPWRCQILQNLLALYKY